MKVPLSPPGWLFLAGVNVTIRTILGSDFAGGERFAKLAIEVDRWIRPLAACLLLIASLFQFDSTNVNIFVVPTGAMTLPSPLESAVTKIIQP